MAFQVNGCSFIILLLGSAGVGLVRGGTHWPYFTGSFTEGPYFTSATKGDGNARDPTVCTDFSSPPGIPSRPIPNVSNIFDTWMEIVVVNKNMTQDVHELFDEVHNRAVIEQASGGVKWNGLYLYDTDEFISYFPDNLVPNSCSVQDLSKSSERFLLGYQTVNGRSHIFSANNALHLTGTGINQHYQGVTSVRGIVADWWRSCQYWAAMNATMVVDWYFSAERTWDSSTGGQVPIMAHVTGRATSGASAPHAFEHYYNFFQFKPYIHESSNSHFQTPASLKCPGRKNTKELPELAKDFSFTTEVRDINGNTTSIMKESIYSSQNLVKYEYHTTEYGSANIIAIHDFNTGVAYLTDQHRGNCSAKPIESSSSDVMANGSDNVRMRTAKEFFYLDGVNVTYLGIKKMRNIDCDTWIGSRTDFPKQFPANSTWVWYFAKNSWQEADPGSWPGAIPIQMKVNISVLNWAYIYNIFNFKKDKPDLLTYDISACYKSSNKRPIQFLLPESSRTLVWENINVFKRFLLQSVVQTVGVSPLRVTNMKVSSSHPLTVTLELLDVAPTAARASQSRHDKEISLDYAATILNRAIQNGQFIIRLTDTAFQQMPELIAVPTVKYTTTTHQPTTTITYPSTQIRNTTGSIFCFSCDETISLSYCLDIKLCNQEEVCVVERFINHASNIRYRSGCKKATECSMPRHTGSGFLTNGNTDLCQQCCSTDFCNSAGCGDQGFPPKEKRGPLCLSCDRVTSVGECDEVIPCKSGQVCSVKGFSWFANKNLNFYGCEDKLDCPNKNDVKGKRSVPICHSCCTDDYCNRNCSKQPDYSIIG